jgi:hypothetical protein
MYGFGDGALNGTVLSDPTGTNTSDDASFEDQYEIGVEHFYAEDEDWNEEEYEEETVDEEYDQNNKELLNSSFVRGVIIAAWDNTMGPRAIKVWHGLGSENKLDEDVVTFVSKFTVIDEISREEEIGNNVELKFNVLKDTGIIILSSVFCAKHNKSKTVFTMSIVMSRDMLTVICKILPSSLTCVEIHDVKPHHQGQIDHFNCIFTSTMQQRTFRISINVTFVERRHLQSDQRFRRTIT